MGFPLINTAKEWRDVQPAPREPRADQVSRTFRAERDPPHAERIGLAATDKYPQRVILSKFNVAGLQRNQFGAARQQVVAERYHGPIAQTPRTVGLDREAPVQVSARHALGLFGTIGLGAAHPPQGQVNVLVPRRIGQRQEPVRLADGVQAPPDTCRREEVGLILEEGTHRRGDRGEGAQAPLAAPLLKNPDVGVVGFHS